ncbi:lysylphosphatidylglycerol synthase transmembrane domain-containing protein [Magnetococcus sp. PR-3]|uniref:lysylphosphatidylglycerol synthase transmembrane domain-containing protein n=1 Tax=Magnetococcus sp. PR-3 TaxID=3120355 RepID=UPI002FCE528A
MKINRTHISLILWVIAIWILSQAIHNWPPLDSWLAHISWQTLLAIGTLVVGLSLATLIRTYRWGLLLQSQIRFNWKTITAVYGWSFLLATFTPFRSGELVRPLWVRKQGGCSFHSFALMVTERIADILILTALLLIWIYTLTDQNIPSFITPMLPWVCILLFVFFLMTPWLSKQLQNQQICPKALGNRPRAVQWCSQLLEGLQAFGSAPERIKIFFVTLTVWGVLITAYIVALMFLLPDIPITAAIGVVCLINLSTLIFMAPGHIGIFELAVIMALSPYNIEEEASLQAAVWLHLGVLIAIILIGGISWVYLRWINSSSVKEAA